MEVEIEMPETNGNVEIELFVPEEILKRILQLKKDETLLFTHYERKVKVTKHENEFSFEFFEYASLEFEMNDYAPERDESRD